MQKKLDPDDKTNFRTVNLSLLFSKVFENVIYDQGNEYVDKFLNKSRFVAFVKLTQRSMHFSDFLRKCQKELKSSGIVGAILMDLSKAYGYLPHDLIIPFRDIWT